MCQLLGMNCNVPTDICFSFTGFHHRGGRTGEHADGWGIAFYEGRGSRLFLDTAPAVRSPIATLVRDYPIRSTNVIAHIRKATVGAVALENTHPFQRAMWGRYWTFAHNGTLRIPIALSIEHPPLPPCRQHGQRGRVLRAARDALGVVSGWPAIAHRAIRDARGGDRRARPTRGVQLSAEQRRGVVCALRDAAHLHRAARTVRDGAPGR